MWGYIADFWCPQALLVVEVDGAGHDPVADQRRDRILASHGMRTIRFSNADVWDRLDYVVATIREVMADRGVALE
jgi:very-short-patch-repair endonuclease